MDLPPTRIISALAARHFVLRATGLTQATRTVPEALAHHGFIQIDPINVCGRMHDLILRPRVHGYREGDLMRHLHGKSASLPSGQRTAFEHHLPGANILVALEVASWPFLQAEMKARARRTSAWSGRLSPREKDVAERVLAEIAARGPLGSDAIADDRRAHHGGGTATLVKAVMQKLFFHGRLLIAQRQNGRRLYDLPERILPPEVREQPLPSANEIARWRALLKLRQRRLVALKRDELPWVHDCVQPLRIIDGPTVYCLRGDLPLLEQPDEPELRPRLLAPLDPLIYDRVLTRRLWDFEYTWEVYTPPAQRRRGYYALPILAGAELIGDVDLRAERLDGRLVVVSRRVRRGYRSREAVADLASFLQLR